MKNLTLILSIVFLSSCFVACCSDDDEEKQTPSETKFIPIKIASDEDELLMTYGSKNQLTKITISTKHEKYGTDTTVIDFTYNDQESVSKITIQYSNHPATTIDFTYKNDSVFIKNTEFNNWSASYIVDKKGFVQKTIELTSKYESTRNIKYDSKDRIIAFENIETAYPYDESASKFITESTFEYDANKGLCSSVNIPQWLAFYFAQDIDDVYYPLMMNTNNIVKVTEKDFESTEFSNFQYQINSYGYPSSYLWGDQESSYNWTVEYEEAN